MADRPHTEASIETRQAQGQLTDRQADRLRGWARDGYAVVDLGGAADRIAPAALDLERAFAGAFPDLLFTCPALGAAPVRWVPELTPHPAAALAIHAVAPAVQALIAVPPISRFLTQILGRPERLFGSEACLRPIAHRPRSGRGLVTLWIALDREPAALGTPLVWPGSHHGGSDCEPIALTPPSGSVVFWHPDLLRAATPVPVLTVRRALTVVFGRSPG